MIRIGIKAMPKENNVYQYECKAIADSLILSMS